MTQGNFTEFDKKPPMRKFKDYDPERIATTRKRKKKDYSNNRKTKRGEEL
jgi:hypothetical protein